MRHFSGRSLLCALAVAMPVTIAAQGRMAAHECAPDTTAPTVAITAIRDAHTLTLADGRDVRLAGIEWPDDAAAADQMKSSLQALLSDPLVRLRPLATEPDRHGRIPALVFAGTDTQPVQQALLAAGHARVAAHVGDKACAASLLKAESEARAARLGLWANPHYVVRAADNPAAVLADKGRFALVEGRVLSVRESGGTIYVNFGRRWSEDFTVTVPKRSEKTFVNAGLELKNLSGRRVRVRGTVEERGGPWIEVVRPEQIEIADRN